MADGILARRSFTPFPTAPPFSILHSQPPELKVDQSRVGLLATRYAWSWPIDDRHEIEEDGKFSYPRRSGLDDRPMGFELVLCILKLELISVKGKTGLFMSTFMIHIRRRTNCANQASALNAEPYSLTGAGNGARLLPPVRIERSVRRVTGFVTNTPLGSLR